MLAMSAVRAGCQGAILPTGKMSPEGIQVSQGRGTFTNTVSSSHALNNNRTAVQSMLLPMRICVLTYYDAKMTLSLVGHFSSCLIFMGR